MFRRASIGGSRRRQRLELPLLGQPPRTSQLQQKWTPPQKPLISFANTTADTLDSLPSFSEFVRHADTVVARPSSFHGASASTATVNESTLDNSSDDTTILWPPPSRGCVSDICWSDRRLDKSLFDVRTVKSCGDLPNSWNAWHDDEGLWQQMALRDEDYSLYDDVTSVSDSTLTWGTSDSWFERYFPTSPASSISTLPSSIVSVFSDDYSSVLANLFREDGTPSSPSMTSIIATVNSIPSSLLTDEFDGEEDSEEWDDYSMGSSTNESDEYSLGSSTNESDEYSMGSSVKLSDSQVELRECALIAQDHASFMRLVKLTTGKIQKQLLDELFRDYRDLVQQWAWKRRVGTGAGDDVSQEDLDLLDYDADEECWPTDEEQQNGDGWEWDFD